MARRYALLVAVGLLGAALAGCGDDAPPDDAPGTTTPTSQRPASSPTTGPAALSTTSPPTATAPSTAPPSTAPPTSAPAASATLPPDERPRSPAVDVTAELAGVSPQASFDALAAEVVRVLEERFPADSPGQATDAAWAASGDAGTVRFRVDGLADDSLAGYDYEVGAAERGGAWVVASATRQAICRRGLAGDLCA